MGLLLFRNPLHGCFDGGLLRVGTAVGGLLVQRILLLTQALLALTFESLQAFHAGLVTAARLLGSLFLLLLGPGLGLGEAVVLHQWNMGWTDPGAAAALDTVEEVVLLGLLQILRAGVPVELLRQQLRRAHLGALAAADAGQGVVRVGRLLPAGHQQAVGALGHRNLVVLQGETHHGAAEDKLVGLVAVAAHVLDDMGHEHAIGNFHVAGLLHALAGDGHQPREQGAARHHRVGHRRRGGHVETDDADFGGNAVGGHLLPGKHLDELLFPAHGIAGGHADHPRGIEVRFGHCLAHGGNGLGLVVLDADEAFAGVHHVHEHADALDDAIRLVAHEQVVAGDVGLALGTVDHQGVDVAVRAGVDLDAGGKGGSPQPHDARPADALAQHGAVQFLEPGQGFRQFAPFVPAVGFQHDAGRRQPGGVGYRLFGDLHHGPRGGRMDGGADVLGDPRNGLALEHFFSCFHQGFGHGADVLLQGNDEPFGQGHLAQETACRHGLHVGAVNAAVKVPAARLPGDHEACSLGFCSRSWPG